MIVLAALDGTLSGLTRPIHEYILQDNEPHPKLAPQYRSDLREDWLLGKDTMRRHDQSKMLQGRLAELRCATWCKASHFEIRGLEALGADTDILARSTAGEDWAIEVKFIGQLNEEFQLVVDALQYRRAVRSFSPYAAVNYVLFRVFEAGVQLADAAMRRAAAIVLSNSAVTAVRRSLDWVDWRNPRFVGNDEDWGRFLEKQRPRYGDVATQLLEKVTSLDDIWLFVPKEGYRIDRARMVMYRDRSIGH